MANVDRNIEVVRRLEALYNARDYSGLGELIGAGFVAHTPASDQTPPTAEGLRANNESAFGAFPDRRTEILDVFGEGDRVVARIRQRGTNEGGLPWLGIPANGKQVDFEWIQISRHDADGRIVETWAQMEIAKLLQQLGAMPGPEGA
jgi:predicted ester cyclase